MESLKGASAGVDTFSESNIASPVLNHIKVSFQAWGPRNSTSIYRTELGFNVRAYVIKLGVGRVICLNERWQEVRFFRWGSLKEGICLVAKKQMKGISFGSFDSRDNSLGIELARSRIIAPYFASLDRNNRG